jgi:hypothetical protein
MEFLQLSDEFPPFEPLEVWDALRQVSVIHKLSDIHSPVMDYELTALLYPKFEDGVWDLRRHHLSRIKNARWPLEAAKLVKWVIGYAGYQWQLSELSHQLIQDHKDPVELRNKVSEILENVYRPKRI